jgi:hypothetical protein
VENPKFCAPIRKTPCGKPVENPVDNFPQPVENFSDKKVLNFFHRSYPQGRGSFPQDFHRISTTFSTGEI